ncbi:hypothetical protein L7F22_025569 [Adiantum nelumboides]|nr:hypothetical protein [Adiantum nelumboides]
MAADHVRGMETTNPPASSAGLLNPTIWAPVSRVNQLDAAKLDVEMTAMLKEQLTKVFSLMQPRLLSRYEPELDAFLEFLVWRFSIWLDKPTPGNALMNLRYRDERGFLPLAALGKVRTGLEGPGLTKIQKIGYCLALVGGRYGWARLQMFSAFHRWGDSGQSTWRHTAWLWLQKAENVYKAASFINLLLFLRTGRYRSLIERLLSARLVYQRPNMSRTVSFEYMNRQLVWHEFSELLLLILPLLNITSIKKALTFPFSSEQMSKTKLKENACPICEQCPITITYVAHPCQHQYCYYCLRTRCIANSSFRCIKCNEQVLAMQRLHVQEKTK